MASLPLIVDNTFIWETKLPTLQSSEYRSPFFMYRNVRWKMFFSLHRFGVNYRYFVVLKTYNDTENFEFFSVLAHLKLKETRTKIQCSAVAVKNGFNFLLNETKELVDKELCINSYTRSLDVTITCEFEPPPRYNRVTEVASGDNSSQLTVDDCKTQKKRKPTKDDSTIKPSESCLKALPHLESLSIDFGDMLQKKILTDVELKCGEARIPAHRAVLMSRSKVFSSMFEHEMVESLTGSVEIKDIEPSVLIEFLKYLYSGKISEDLSSEVILELYNASDKYAVESLQEGCRNVMVSNLTEQNCIEILTLGEKHCDQQLEDIVVDFIIKRPSVLKSDAWMEFSDIFPKLANAIFRKYVVETS